jgi:serine/threonine protein kinase/tetratricopeptide (TPR) repeat protein
MANHERDLLLRLFGKALELPPAARPAWLDSKCGVDAELKQQLQAMLAAAGDEQFRAAAPPEAEATVAKAPLQEGPGATIGPYRLLQQLGEGGFGVVFLAEQTEPVARKVALKIIKLGMDTRQVVARFEQERQALALMDHPNIARVIDAGATATGRPYFVMELVKGSPIGEYCDQNSLTVDERLELFAQVCSAVQHAHQKGIIHRDLKPNNLLVAMQDGRPQVKVIDFGIAKATSHKLTDKTLFTEQEQVIGTLQYMSPEQAAGSLDIDTRTDVYALGVVLYELLTGSTPFDTKLLREAVHSELMLMIREVEPQRPSTRLSESHATLAALAARRRVEPARLGTLVRGELDWIVMKALEKDRGRRYESASSLGLDIGRHLRGEAVQAAPPSAAYRLRKFVRRNRATVVSAVAVTAALLIGVVAFAWQASIARDQRDRAMHAEDQTSRRAEELQKVADYQARMLQQIDATETGVRLMADLRTRHDAALDKSKVPEAEKSARTAAFARELHAVNATDAAVALLDRTVLAPAVRAIETQFADQPLVEASLRTTLGVVYHALGRPEQALLLYQRAYALRAQVLGEEHRDTLASRFGVGRALGELQQLAEAETAVRATLAGYQRVLGEDADETLATRSLLAMQMYYQGKYEDCEAMSRDVLERRRRVRGPDHPDTLEAMNDLGKFSMNRGKYADAETVLREVVERQRRVADAAVADGLGNLGLVLLRQSKYTEAEPCLREALERRRRDQGEDHPQTLAAISNLATLLMDAGKLAEAEPLARESLEKCRRLRGNEHAETLKAMNVMGQVLFRQDKMAETEPYYREALATGRRVLGEEHPDTIIWIAAASRARPTRTRSA